MHSHGLHTSKWARKRSSKSQCRENLTKELSSSVMVQTKRRLMNEQRHFYLRFQIFNCLQNIGFQLESILCEQCVLLCELLSEKLQISIMVFGPKFNKSTCAKGCFLGTEYTPHGRWQFFQQLGSHDA